MRDAKEEQTSLRGILGELEQELAEWAWQQPSGELRVRQVYEEVGLSHHPPLAYTTIMTVMGHLADKGIFTRRREGKTHYYRVAMNREQFIANAAARQVEKLVANFGDLALAQFIEQLAAADPGRLARIKEMSEKVGTEGE